jgi:hypothetical protein
VSANTAMADGKKITVLTLSIQFLLRMKILNFQRAVSPHFYITLFWGNIKE